jgi:hypothetical protein
VADLADVRRIALDLPRAYEAIVRDYVKSLLGFGFPKEARESLVASDPETFLMPVASDLRYNWVQLRLARVDVPELDDLLVEAWRMCVPKKVAAEYLRRAD